MALLASPSLAAFLCPGSAHADRYILPLSGAENSEEAERIREETTFPLGKIRNPLLHDRF
jgi:hypothetical protein